MMRQAIGTLMRSMALGSLFIGAVLPLAGCGGSSSTSSGTVAATVSGVVTDSSGNPVSGATVVAGSSSPTGLTDQNGAYSVSGINENPVIIHTITPGYASTSFSIGVSSHATTAVTSSVELPDVDDVANEPFITNVSLQPTATSVAVTATVTPGGSQDGLTDVRAELVGYGVGSVMTPGSGGSYSATISLPTTFVGPSALVEVFAIDAKGRVGVNTATAAVPNASGTGNFTATTFTGNWAGGSEYHRASFGSGGDRMSDRRRANASLTISNGNVSGTVADIQIEKPAVIAPANWAVVEHAFTGTVSLIDASLGYYEITGSVPLNTATLNFTLIGKLDSATAPTNFVGFYQGTLTLPTTPATTVTIFGRTHLINGLTWSLSDLDGAWVWSQFIRNSAITSPTTYDAPFQFNSSFQSASGVISSFADTFGTGMSSSTTFSIDALGKFTGQITTSDGAVFSVSGLIGPEKARVDGLFSVLLSGKSAYGGLWGNKIATPPHFATADFGQKKFDGTTAVALWRGFYVASAGPDSGALCYLSLWTTSAGSVVGGKVNSLGLGTCPSVTFSSGSVAFSNTTDGEFGGTATGGSTTVTLGPSGGRNASMGVEKARLVGDISVPVSGGTDTGFFFVQRTFIE